MKPARNDKNRIIESAMLIFSHYGVKATSMDDIASRCGISKKTLYEHFDSKDALLTAVIQNLTARNEQFLRVCPGISPDAITEMSNFFNHLQNMLEIFTPFFFREIKKYYPAVWQILLQYRNNALTPYVRQNLNRGIAENIYRTDFNPDVAVKLFIWQLQAAMEEASFSENERHRIMSYAHHFFLLGLLNAKGMKLGMQIMFEGK